MKDILAIFRKSVVVNGDIVTCLLVMKWFKTTVKTQSGFCTLSVVFFPLFCV